MTFSEFYLWNLRFISRAPMRNSLWRFKIEIINYIYSHALKNVKKGGIVQIIVVQGFCPLKVEITQFSDGFRLNFYRSDGWKASFQNILSFWYWVPVNGLDVYRRTYLCTIQKTIRIICDVFPFKFWFENKEWASSLMCSVGFCKQTNAYIGRDWNNKNGKLNQMDSNIVVHLSRLYLWKIRTGPTRLLGKWAFGPPGRWEVGRSRETRACFSKAHVLYRGVWNLK